MKKMISILTVVLAFIFSIVGLAVADTYHSGTSINSNETWTAEGNPHIIKALTTVKNGATLTIEPGVEVRFNPEATNPRLIIGESSGGTSGTLIAIGTDTQKIIFTSDSINPQPGDWSSINFNYTATDNSIIENAIVEYGGSSNGNYANITISGSNPTIRNTIIRKSSGTGIYVGQGSSSEILTCTFEENLGSGIEVSNASPIIGANEFYNNGSYPIYVVGGISYPIIYGPTVFSGNNKDAVRLGIGSITNDYTLYNINYPYYLPSLTTVKNGATLTIEPGVEVRFNPDATNPTLIIGDGGSGTSGTLIAIGTDTQKIIFTSDSINPQPGDWNSIHFWPTATDNSIIENAIIEYGGSSSGGHENIEIYGSNPTIRKTIIRKSSGPGIYVHGGSISEISCSIFTENNIGIKISNADPIVTFNNIFNNSAFGISNSSSSYIVNAQYNWWGDLSGPGGFGSGSGDSVSDYVEYSPWLGSPSDCTMPISAEFEADTLIGIEDLTVYFNDRSTSPEGVSAWSWDFNGDSIIDSTDQNPVFTYEEPGIYTVTLTAYEADGDFDMEVKEQYITVEESRPIADFSGGPLVGTAPHTVLFNDNSLSSGTDTLTLWQWDFNGDGIIDSGYQNAQWIYNQAGVYTIALTVTDDDGDSDTMVKENYVTVLPPGDDTDDEFDTPDSILTLNDTDSTATISSSSTSILYGSGNDNNIIIEAGGKAKLLNTPGNNTITIEADSSIFTVSRSGAYVTFEGTDDTVLKIPATLESQTIIFDNESLSLVIDSGKVMLGNQEISLTPSAIN